MNENRHEVTPRAGIWPAVFAAGCVGLAAPALYLGIIKFTHHRPLGAATLAAMSLVVFVFLLAVAWRLNVGRTLALLTVVATAIGLTVATLIT
jgi:hypothetical protein